jgi:hypothetical protein
VTRASFAIAPLLLLAGCHESTRAGPAAASSTSASPDPSACVAAVADHQRALAGHLDAARLKMSARDGKGCLAELDAYDKDAWTANPSTSAASAMAMSRAMCTMLAGDCKGGKDLYRASLATSAGPSMGPETIDRSVDAIASLYCEGGAMEPRDALLKALMVLNRGAYMETTTAEACRSAVDAAKLLIAQVQPRGPDDNQVLQAPAIVRIAGPECFARAGDCDAAWTTFRETWLATKAYDEGTLRTMFTSIVKRCPSK